jgi:N-acetyl-gamma-glutamylphosphate reductase
LLEEAVYGLPELNRDAIKKRAPDRQSGLLPDHHAAGLLSAAEGRPDRRRRNLIADCKSGVSGAGRKAEIGTLFSESSDNFKAYGVAGHRHTPETSAQLQRFTDQKVGLIFTPHLVPMIRGMHSTLYARLTRKSTTNSCKPCSRSLQGCAVRRCDAVRFASGNPLDPRFEHAAHGAAPSGQRQHRRRSWWCRTTWSRALPARPCSA